MQSIWHGRMENIFASKKERQVLLDYTKKALDFAAELKCGNLVFGCPKNRHIPDDCLDYTAIANEFFAQLADYAESGGTVIALEANPSLYGTNFVSTTAAAFAFVKALKKKGLKVNVDTGTMISNEENLEIVAEGIALVNHIHISEPNLVPLEKRALHAELKTLKYDRYLSIEMKTQKNIETVKKAVEYVRGLF
jgi:sugar phosphate isomerase/epimerase